ncbi:hypothetical protein [Massilia putida]|uniref:hypothetical protein n=1 Tax=Massilia putida TaxID=1141883 RepID=UPI000953186C|nr:hypothetical protein [Massilia putida]
MDKLPQFKWRSGYGDVICHRYDDVVQDYWTNVALPALDHAVKEVAFWASNQEGAAPFVHANMVDQLSVTAAAMCLSIQSIWERQLRAYLLACIDWKDDKLAKRIQHATWDALQALFTELRGVPMQAFLSYHDLNLLAQLGNVCRHGAGRTANALWRNHPSLWPGTTWPADSALAPPIEQICIGKELLARMVDAIASFWQMIGYLYKEGITVKHESLVRALPADRAQFADAIAHFNFVVREIGLVYSTPPGPASAL